MPRPVDSDRSGAVVNAPCAAPFSSLYLDPKGVVRACCQNEWVRLGRVGESSLQDIWRGARAQELREAALVGDWSLGCEQCDVAIKAVGESGAYARVFDSLLPVERTPAWPRQMELALSNACNLQCIMCNGELSSAIRIHREHREPLPEVYGDAFFAELDDFLPHLESIVFLGGEPFLGREPLRVIRRLTELGLAPVCSVTTNGTVWNDRVEGLLRSLPFHVTVSVDGASAEINESVRVGVDHEQLVHNIGEIRRVQREVGRTFSLSFTMLNRNSQELGAVLRWADRLDVDCFVNQVTHPPALSLVHLDPDALHRVYDSLAHEQASDPGALGRNRPVWDRELAMLRALVTSATAAAPPAEVPVALRRPSRDRMVAVVTAGPDQLIHEVDPGATGSLGLDLPSLVGAPIWDIVGHLLGALGEVRSSRLERLDSGGELRSVSFRSGERIVAMQAELLSLADGRQRWTLDLDPG